MVKLVFFTCLVRTLLGEHHSIMFSSIYLKPQKFFKILELSKPLSGEAIVTQATNVYDLPGNSTMIKIHNLSTIPTMIK